MRAVFWISIFSFIWLTGFPEPCPADVSTPDSPPETNGTFQEVITEIPSEPSAPEEPVGMIADPLEPLNRVFFYFNDKFYFWLLKPAATGYKTVVPQDARVGVRNFFSNLTTLIRLVNCMLQVNFKGAGNETVRLLLNSTFGLLGFIDIAKKELNIEKSEEDFGQTLGFWGIGPVIYIDWPILGPSSLRDTVGFVGDLSLDFRTYVFKSPIFYVVRPYELVNDTSLRIGEYEDLKEAAIDPYTALKDAYHQYRQNKIRQR
jgi:phospholipid-binding lipoprotein MlaA